MLQERQTRVYGSALEVRRIAEIACATPLDWTIPPWFVVYVAPRYCINILRISQTPTPSNTMIQGSTHLGLILHPRPQMMEDVG